MIGTITDAREGAGVEEYIRTMTIVATAAHTRPITPMRSVRLLRPNSLSLADSRGASGYGWAV